MQCFMLAAFMAVCNGCRLRLEQLWLQLLDELLTSPSDAHSKTLVSQCQLGSRARLSKGKVGCFNPSRRLEESREPHDIVKFPQQVLHSNWNN